MADPEHSTNGSDPLSSFDTMANLRALGEVQRRGLEAANQVIGRLVEQTERSAPLFGAEPPGGGSSQAGSSGDPFAQFADLMRSAVAAMFDAVSGGASASASPAAAPEGISTDALSLDPVGPGASASGELWLHNRSGADVGGVRLHCGDLRTHDGWAIPADHVTFAPDGEFDLPDRTSRGIGVTVSVGVEAVPGVYRGTVLAANLPDVWLPVELVVTPS